MTANNVLYKTLGIGRYPIGSKIQDRRRYIFIKKADGHWIAEHRWVMQQKLARDLHPGERVYHKNGIPDDNRVANLVPIQFSTQRYELLPTRRILFVPGYQKNIKTSRMERVAS